MDYGKIKGKNYFIILFEYYMVCHGKSSNDIFIKSTDLKKIIDDLNKTEEDYIFFDMKCVKKAASRSFAFLKEEEVLDKIVFFMCKKEAKYMIA